MRLSSATVSPYVISATAVGTIALLMMMGAASLFRLALVAAFVAGWSSAWSP
jgi:hypothetical protein